MFATYRSVYLYAAAIYILRLFICCIWIGGAVTNRVRAHLRDVGVVVIVPLSGADLGERAGVRVVVAA